MDSEVIYPKDIKVSKLRYSPVKKMGTNGPKMVYINYGDEKLTVQTPLMSLPYGVNDGSMMSKDAAGAGGRRGEDEDIGGNNKRYDMSLSFRGMDTNPKIKTFYDKMVEVEKKIMDDAFANREAWLGDDYEGMRTIVNKLMNPMLRFDRDKETGKVVGKYPPTMKVKLPYDRVIDNFVFDAVDMDGAEIDFKDIVGKLKGTKTIAIIQLTGLYFVGGKYGCMWKVKSGMFQKINAVRKMAFRPDSDVEDNGGREAHTEDDDDLADEAAAVAATKKPAAKAAVPTVISDSEDEAAEDTPPAEAAAEESEEAEEEESEEIEESEEEEPTPPPPPPPAPKKKAAAAPKKAAK